MTDRPRSPLDEAVDELRKMTPEELKRWQQDLRERIKRQEEEERERRNRPPETKTGVCVVCGGTVEGQWEHGLRPGVDIRRVPMGPGSKGYFGWNFKGYGCA